jgi:hypothetical protein
MAAVSLEVVSEEATAASKAVAWAARAAAREEGGMAAR